MKPHVEIREIITDAPKRPFWGRKRESGRRKDHGRSPPLFEEKNGRPLHPSLPIST